MTSKVEFSISGTLGDAFLAFCKLSGYHERTGNQIRLYRYSGYPGFDVPLSQFFQQIPYIEYITPCIYLNYNVLHSIKDWPAFQGLYINSGWNSDGHGIFPNDPGEVKFNPFPEVYIDPVELKGKNLGIQLHCGSIGHNFRGFSVSWVGSLAQRLKDLEATIHVLGTGSGYNKRELKQLDQISNIQNWIGKTKFLGWLSLIKSMDAFISLEGFSTFFAMSQRVPTFLYNQYRPGIMGSVHPAWRDASRLVNRNSNWVINKLRSFKIRKLGMRNLFSPRNHKELKIFLYNILEGNIDNAK